MAKYDDTYIIIQELPKSTAVVKYMMQPLYANEISDLVDGFLRHKPVGGTTLLVACRIFLSW